MSPGGQVRVQVAQTAGPLSLSVADSGPGVPDDELPRLFGRIYRADTSSSRCSGGGGLGLAVVQAIAQAIAQAHGARVSARRAELGGLEVEVVWEP